MVEYGKLLCCFMFKVISQLRRGHYSNIILMNCWLVVLLIYTDKGHHYQMLLKCLYQKELINDEIVTTHGKWML